MESPQKRGLKHEREHRREVQRLAREARQRSRLEDARRRHVERRLESNQSKGSSFGSSAARSQTEPPAKSAPSFVDTRGASVIKPAKRRGQRAAGLVRRGAAAVEGARLSSRHEGGFRIDHGAVVLWYGAGTDDGRRPSPAWMLRQQQLHPPAPGDLLEPGGGSHPAGRRLAELLSVDPVASKPRGQHSSRSPRLRQPLPAAPSLREARRAWEWALGTQADEMDAPLAGARPPATPSLRELARADEASRPPPPRGVQDAFAWAARAAEEREAAAARRAGVEGAAWAALHSATKTWPKADGGSTDGADDPLAAKLEAEAGGTLAELPLHTFSGEFIFWTSAHQRLGTQE
jgi:hypothetical protein